MDVVNFYSCRFVNGIACSFYVIKAFCIVCQDPTYKIKTPTQ